MSNTYQKDRESLDYRRWKDNVLFRFDYQCQACGSTENLQAHHIYNFSSNPCLRFNTRNGIILCEKCHDPEVKGSFHDIYGVHDNNEKQLVEFLDKKNAECNFQRRTIPLTLYKGFRYISDNDLAKIYEGQDFLDLSPNEYLITSDNKILKFQDGNVVEVNSRKLKPGTYTDEIKALNIHQTIAMDLLLDKKIDLVAIIAQAGAGKSFLATQIGMYLLEKGNFDKLIYVRNNIPIGKDIGYLPGNLLDKILPWASPLIDQSTKFVVDLLMEAEKIELATLTHMQGRSFKNCFIVVDEAQNLTREQVKMLATRAGENTKLVFTGDIEQILHREFQEENNGLIRLIDKFQGQDIFGCVELQKTVRSRLAELAATLL